MKRPNGHISLSCLLTAIILFGQVAVNYFHNKHDAHVIIEKHDVSRTLFNTHHDHCKVCSLEIFQNLHFEPAQEPNAQQHSETAYAFCQFRSAVVHILTIPGRAPPAC